MEYNKSAYYTDELSHLVVTGSRRDGTMLGVIHSGKHSFHTGSRVQKHVTITVMIIVIVVIVIIIVIVVIVVKPLPCPFVH